MRGATTISIDAKGRFAIPGKYRDALVAPSAGRLIVTLHPHGCLLLYPEATWLPIEQRLKSLSSFDGLSAGMQRAMLGNAEELEMDSAGRLLLSANLKAYANLGQELKMVGMTDHFELWQVEEWNKQIEDSRVKPSETVTLPAELQGFSL